MERKRTDKNQAVSDAEIQAKNAELVQAKSEIKALCAAKKELSEDKQIVETDLSIANTNFKNVSAQLIEMASSKTEVDSIYKVKIFESELTRTNLDQDVDNRDQQLQQTAQDAVVLLQMLDRIRYEHKTLQSNFDDINVELRDVTLAKEMVVKELEQLRAILPDIATVEIEEMLRQAAERSAEEARASLKILNQELKVSLGEKQELEDQVLSARHDVDVMLVHVEKLEISAKLSNDDAMRNDKKAHALETHCSALGAIITDQYREAKINQGILNERTQQLEDSSMELSNFRIEADDIMGGCEEEILRKMQALEGRCKSKDVEVKVQKDLVEKESLEHTLARSALAIKTEELETITRKYGDLMSTLEGLSNKSARQIKSTIKAATEPAVREERDQGINRSEKGGVATRCLKRVRRWLPKKAP